MKQTFKVYGMMCAACASHVEHAVQALSGVTAVAVSLLTNSMQVEYEGEIEDAIVQAVRHAGYSAQPQTEGAVTLTETAKTRWTPIIISLVLSAVLMYVEMGEMLLPFPSWLSKAAHPTLSLAVQLAIVLPIVVLNYRYFVGGTRSLLARAPNMDSLIALGSGTAIIYSTVLFFICLLGTPSAQLAAQASFSSGGMILALVSLGKTLEGRAKDKTADAIRALSALTPDTVTVWNGAQEEHISQSALTVEHTLVLKTGDRIPCDGRILSGALSVDESAVTGESLPIDKALGDAVTAGCIVTDGAAHVVPTAVGEQTSLSKTIRMVSEASATKAPIAKLADRVSAYFVPAVLAVALVTLAVWLITTHDVSLALTHAISVLVISCPCALGLATPTAIMCAMGKGAQLGILIKSAEALEHVGRIRTVAFDKTGTLTTGHMTVCDAYVCTGHTSEELFSIAYAIESQSKHPVACAVAHFTKGAKELPTERISTMQGKGMFAKTPFGSFAVGNAALMDECEVDLTELHDFKERSDARGASIVYVASSEEVIGAFAIADTPKKDSADAVQALKTLGIRSLMLTGDTPAAAQSVASSLGITTVYPSLTPEEKGEKIKELRQNDKIAMVGDGINDCLPLVAADVGIAMGAGSDVAIESCDIVLRGDRMKDVVKLLRLGRFTLKKIRQNLFWALIYNTICIPIAAGALSALGITLSPMMASAAMALSSLTVVGNALLIKRFQ